MTLETLEEANRISKEIEYAKRDKNLLVTLIGLLQSQTDKDTGRIKFFIGSSYGLVDREHLETFLRAEIIAADNTIAGYEKELAEL